LENLKPAGQLPKWAIDSLLICLSPNYAYNYVEKYWAKNEVTHSPNHPWERFVKNYIDTAKIIDTKKMSVF